LTFLISLKKRGTNFKEAKLSLKLMRLACMVCRGFGKRQ